MSKMNLHDPFGHLKHKLWPKEGPRVKLAIWLPTTKSRKSPQFPYVQVVCHITLESFQWRIQLCFKLHFNWKFACKVMGSQSYRSPNFGTKWPLCGSPMARHRIYYKGEGGGFPQVQALVSLVNLCLPVIHPCTKVLQLCTNQLVVWFV
jgi:hypothetical protein